MLYKSVEQNILLANAIDLEFLDAMVSNLVNRGVDFCDLYLQKSAYEAFGIDESIIKGASYSEEQGIGVRSICDDKTYLSYSNSISDKTIRSLVNDLFIEPQQHKLVYQPSIKQDYSNSLFPTQNPITESSSGSKVSCLQYIDNKSRQYAYVSNVIANITMEYDEICIVNSKKTHAFDIRPLIRVNITLIINKAGKIEKGSSGFGGRYLFNQITEQILDKHIEKAYNQALLKLDAVNGPSGEIPVVLGNAWAGVILHEAVGHGLEGDFNRRGSSAFSNRIGEVVASSNVTIIDQGNIESRRGSLNIDDEGNPTQRTVLIENGILKGYMFDELNAKLMNTVSTGNGRRESYACSPIPRMTNTYMLGGEYTHEDIIQSVEYGIYAESFEGGQVDITSGQFVFNANVAWLIKNGKLQYPIKGCALVGNGPECLKYVSMVGNNSQLDDGIGVCGKNGQGVPVGVGQPTIRIDSGLIVGGA